MARFFNFSGDYTGLKSNAVQENLNMYGYNTYRITKKADNGFSYLEVLLSPSALLMLIAGVLCFFGAGIGSGIMVLLIDTVYVFTEIYFRKSSDKRIEEISAGTCVKYRVIREGKLELIDKELIVPEDIIVVGAGERVPADAFILESKDLTCDESIFTGSSKPVAKYTEAISKTELKQNFVYSGTTVLTGTAICRVSATGVDTKIFQRIGEFPDDHSYYTNLEKIVHGIIPICAGIAVLLFLLSAIIRFVSGGEVIAAALSGITLALCFIPTGIASIIRLYYTKGAVDMLKNGAAVKSLSDIEKLNSLSVLCVEKEGAISKNNVEVRSIYTRSEVLLYNVALLACDRNTTNPFERALMVKATFFDEHIADIYDKSTFIEKLPDNDDAIGGALWNVGGDRLYCIKGAPEQILPMCRLNGDALLAAQKRYEDYYASGCSVIAFACVEADGGNLDTTRAFSYTFVGFAAFSAPLRESVAAAVKTCRRSGVRVVMLTEENPSIAESTGRLIGLSGDNIVIGEQLSAWEEYGEEPDFDTDIYANISPLQKRLVIDRLKSNGEVVAMTGTRPSDADLLDSADVGITISSHSSNSCCESADIIMNNDNFPSIADTIAKARQIHRNIKRAVSVLISGYTGLLILTVFNLFGNEHLMLNPALIALITMILLPLASLAFLGFTGDIKTGIMPPSEFVASRKINYRFLGNALLMGALSGGVAVISYALMYNGSNFAFARSCALISYLICTSGFLVLRHNEDISIGTVIRSSLLSKLAVGVTALIPIFLTYIPFINTAFELVPIDLTALLISIITGCLPPIVYYLVRRFVFFGRQKSNTGGTGV